MRHAERLAEAGIESLVGSDGASYDNALAETINGPFKAEVTRAVQIRISRVRGHLLNFLVHPGAVKPNNKGLEQLLRQAVVAA